VLACDCAPLAIARRRLADEAADGLSISLRNSA